MFSQIISSLVQPVSKNLDHARREFILNVLLLGSIILTFLANLWTWFGELTASPDQKKGFEGTSLQLLGILAFFLICYYLSRAGKSKWVSYVLVLLYVTLASLTASRWGVSVPQNLLIYAFTIVMAGILVSARFSFFISGLIVTILLTILHLQSIGILILNTEWRFKLATYGDVALYGVTLFLTALVSWLFNREMERALVRARRSEEALRKERDNLEITVAKRTSELKRSQAEKLIQMYQFAEFGKLASGLFHDLVNPLTTVSLNIENLHNKKDLSEMRELLNSAKQGTKQLEGFVQAARKQIQQQKVNQMYPLQEEIDQALQMLDYKAKEHHVKLTVSAESLTTQGNPVKFYQLVLNLVSNAIDAYEGVIRKDKSVHISLEKKGKNAILQIKDQGKGIASENLTKIFEPLFTTKSAYKGVGMGLSIVKDIVTKELKGTINVKSKPGETTFTVIFPLSHGKQSLPSTEGASLLIRSAQGKIGT